MDSKSNKNDEVKLGWNNCHIDIWFSIAKFIRPEDTLTFSMICRQTKAVVESELYWSRVYEKFVLAKYPWLDKPKQTDISCKLEGRISVKFISSSNFRHS